MLFLGYAVYVYTPMFWWKLLHWKYHWFKKRVHEHQLAGGANYTKKKAPVTLVYYEEFVRIDDAFNREKQIQGWSHEKKRALIENNTEKLYLLAECQNKTNSKNYVPD